MRRHVDHDDKFPTPTALRQTTAARAHACRLEIQRDMNPD